jgi:hypothetical protein
LASVWLPTESITPAALALQRLAGSGQRAAVDDKVTPLTFR